MLPAEFALVSLLWYAPVLPVSVHLSSAMMKKRFKTLPDKLSKKWQTQI
jgi:hypothetical protein